jgi:hypothetical protein
VRLCGPKIETDFVQGAENGPKRDVCPIANCAVGRVVPRPVITLIPALLIPFDLTRQTTDVT